jgi:hypothetical protein
MRNRVASMVLLWTFALSGCGGVRIEGLLNPQFALFGGELVQPSTTTVVIPSGSTVIVVIEEVPINGVVLGGTEFLNDFNGANPAFAFCPSVLNVVNNGIMPATNFLSNAPSIGLTLSPIGPGTCQIPINLGTGGTIILNVTIG